MRSAVDTFVKFVIQDKKSRNLYIKKFNRYIERIDVYSKEMQELLIKNILHETN